MELIKEQIEKLLDRKKLVYRGEFKSTTPSRAELQLEIAKMQKADPKLVVVENISTKYGTNEVTITAFVYDNEKVYQEIVPKHLAKKSEVKVEEKPKEETTSEEKSPEVEGNKEESSTEETSEDKKE